MSKKHCFKEDLSYTHMFKIHLPNLLDETINSGLRPKDKAALSIPLKLFLRYMHSVAHRASQINDPILNKLMCELTLYDVADPTSTEYNKAILNEINEKAKKYIENEQA